MSFTILAAHAVNRVIGKDNDLPWNIPEDLQHFRFLTYGGYVVMGRKTFESIAVRRKNPLPNRHMVVITSQPNLHAERYRELGVIVVGSFREAIREIPVEHFYVIGGEQLYNEAIGHPDAKYMILTEVFLKPEGDAYFPLVDPKRWELSSATKVLDSTSGTGFRFVTYQRK